MRLMKKMIASILVAGMSISMIGCGSKVPENTVFTVSDLEGKKIGVQLGTTGADYVAENYGEGSIDRYSKGADAVQALKQGKVDCVVIDIEPAKAFVKKNSDLKILEEEITSEEYAMCLAKDNTELLEQVNQALAELKEDGTIEKIIDNYIGDNIGKNPYESPADVDQSNGTLVMATNAFFPPYEYYDEQQNIVGIDVDITRAICDKIGMELEIMDIDFDAIIPAVQSGKAEIGVAGMTVTEERLQNINFTEPYTTSGQVVIVRNK